MQVASRLTAEEFRILAEGPLFSIFRTLEFQQEPFRESVEDRFIIGDMDGFQLLERQFRAVSRAAHSVGDHFMFLSGIRAAEGGIENNTWKIPLFDYECYETPRIGPMFVEDFRATKGFLDEVLYSPRGEWGILCPELFALAGGSLRFTTHLKHEYPEWREDLVAFLEGFREGHQKRGTDVSWVQPLLQHLYRDEAPVFEV